MLPFWVRVELGAMAMNGCSAFPKAPTSLEPTIRSFSVTSKTLIGGRSLGVGLTPLQRCCQCILQPQPTGQSSIWSYLSSVGTFLLLALSDWATRHRVVNWFSFCLLNLHVGFILFTNPSARAGYDTRSIFKRSLTGFNSEFSFS